MDTKGIIELLRAGEVDYLKTTSFSQLPGIYALFFIGLDFPILGQKVSNHQIIYIGKTETSQEQRDLKTHFTTGKTGSSTVRKSIGAILSEKEKLAPIPRNHTDYQEGRFSHFKFDDESEIIITNWMRNNLALSFYEYPKTKQEIEDLETKLIHELIPILNISKNLKNDFKSTLEKLRKKCAAAAQKNYKLSNENKMKTPISNSEDPKADKTQPLFGSIFIDNITETDVASNKIRIKVENKHFFPMEKSGNPYSYTLDLIIDGIYYLGQYTIGSKDGKSRSGILNVGNNVYQDILKIKPGTILKISKSIDSKYTIERK